MLEVHSVPAERLMHRNGLTVSSRQSRNVLIDGYAFVYAAYVGHGSFGGL